MANIKQILLPDGTTYDIIATYADMAHIAEITEEAVTAQTATYATQALNANHSTDADYATRAGRSNYLQSVDANSIAYDNIFLLRSRYNKWNDRNFGLEIVNNDSSITTNYGVRVDYATSAESTLQLKTDSQIPANANLNDYKSPGHRYSCPASATAATLSNRPTNDAFVMDVLALTNTFIVQILYVYEGQIYKRTYKDWSNTWSSWIEVVCSNNYTSVIKSTLNLNAGQMYRIGSRCALSDLGTTAGAVLGNNGVFARSYSNSNAYVNMYAAGFSQQSSKLVKENINPITEEEAKKLLDIDVVSFDYIEAVGGQKNNVGMIAEDMLEIYPNLVQVPDNYSEEKAIESIYEGNNTETLALDYAKFTPYLIKMIQMQQKQINDLKRRFEG